MRQIAKLLPGLPDPAPLAAFLPKIDRDAPTRALRCRVAAATTLVAGLELARNGGLALDQDADWVSIRVTRRGDGQPIANAFRTGGVTAAREANGSAAACMSERHMMSSTVGERYGVLA
jgi:hypothetical protein